MGEQTVREGKAWEGSGKCWDWEHFLAVDVMQPEGAHHSEWHPLL